MTDARAQVLDDLANGRFEYMGEAVSAARAALAANNQEAWVAALLNAPNPEQTTAATPAVGGELRSLADNIRSKVEQLKNYRDHGCQLDHAKTIAEGRILQANQILHWIDTSLAALPASPLRGEDDLIDALRTALAFIDTALVADENPTMSKKALIQTINHVLSVAQDKQPLRYGEPVWPNNDEPNDLDKGSDA